jgi:DNA repair exonuclease SbcCD ATPase subunit
MMLDRFRQSIGRNRGVSPSDSPAGAPPARGSRPLAPTPGTAPHPAAPAGRASNAAAGPRQAGNLAFSPGSARPAAVTQKMNQTKEELGQARQAFNTVVEEMRGTDPEKVQNFERTFNQLIGMRENNMRTCQYQLQTGDIEGADKTLQGLNVDGLHVLMAAHQSEILLGAAKELKEQIVQLKAELGAQQSGLEFDLAGKNHQGTDIAARLKTVDDTINQAFKSIMSFNETSAKNQSPAELKTIRENLQTSLESLLSLPQQIKGLEQEIGQLKKLEKTAPAAASQPSKGGFKNIILDMRDKSMGDKTLQGKQRDDMAASLKQSFSTDELKNLFAQIKKLSLGNEDGKELSATMDKMGLSKIMVRDDLSPMGRPIDMSNSEDRKSLLMAVKSAAA